MIPSFLTGKILRDWRVNRSLSQADLAEKLGISEGSIRNYESESRPDKKEPVQIPRLLDWALAALHARLRPLSETLGKKEK